MKINQSGGHLDQMLRQTRDHHVQLSSMADMKANMLLTMSAVVITLSAPHVFRTNFQWPFLVLICFCLITVGLAAYAVMPKFPPRNQASPDIHDPQFNVLFFGDFVRLDYPRFEAAMEEMMNDPSRAYEAQVRELYVLGVFLSTKKYRFLRLAYVSFLVGIFVSFLLLLILSAL